MTMFDWAQALGNLANSMGAVRTLIYVFTFILGLFFGYWGLICLKKHADSKGQEPLMVPLAYLFFAGVFISLPYTLSILSNTFYGNSSILQYGSVPPFDTKKALRIILQTMGIIWVVRGCALIAHASEPGVQHGPKGFAFLFGGILAFNFTGTLATLDWLFKKIETLLGLSAS
ncbi:MAG: type IV secretion protein IcmC [Legionellaceae bacterium]|nr:type IV secretion protein IcmC [Legionellaceae bacterium]